MLIRSSFSRYHRSWSTKMANKIASNSRTYYTPTQIGMGRVFIMGSGIGSDSSMVASNDRITKTSMVNNNNNNNSNTKRFFTTSMEDEYGEMTDDGFTYTHPKPFVLESGEVLEEASLRYQTYGTLDPVKRDNVIVVCHALTGTSNPS